MKEITTYGKKRRRIGKIIGALAGIAVLAALVVPTWWEAVANRDRVETKSYDFTESAREVKNPNRGFYRMYSFPITDKKTNYKKLIANLLKRCYNILCIIVFFRREL